MIDDENLNEEGIALVIKTEDGRYKCGECPFTKTFSSFKRFLTHVKSHNTICEEDIKALEAFALTKNTFDTEMCEEIKSESGLLSYRCKICLAEFSLRKQLLLHIQIHKNSEEAHNRSSKLITSVIKHSCLVCNKTFEEKYEYDMHLAAHKENNTYEAVKKPNKPSSGVHKCQYCNKGFNRPHEKVKHERVHTNEKPYACDVRIKL